MVLKLGQREYLTAGEAAKLVGVSIQTIRVWDNKGKLKAKRHPINNYRLYKKADIEKLLRSVR